MDQLSVILVWALGLIMSSIVGHFIIKRCVCFMRRRISDSKNEESNRFTDILGIIERVLYSTFLVMMQYKLIYLWFGLKIAQRMITYTKIHDENDLQKAGASANVYILGNLLSLGFGILGGLIIIFLLNRLNLLWGRGQSILYFINKVQ